MSQNRKILYILNGGCMLEDFKKQGKMKEGCTYVACNEAMCWGEADEVIFGGSVHQKPRRFFAIDPGTL